MAILQRIFQFYYQGFKNMTTGKTLWVIILLKLFVMFAILKVFFFPKYLDTHFSTNEEKANHVVNELIQNNKQ